MTRKDFFVLCKIILNKSYEGAESCNFTCFVERKIFKRSFSRFPSIKKPVFRLLMNVYCNQKKRKHI